MPKTRLKYQDEGQFLSLEIYDIFNNQVLVTITKGFPAIVIITKSRGQKEMQKRVVELESFQNAKRKVRMLLKEEFDVNLYEEIRSKLCM